MKRRDLIKRLKQVGYKSDRNNKHEVYECPGRKPVQIPNHREIDETTASEILKAAGLK